MPRIYTRTGDNILTGTFGGKRVPKNSVRIECIGTIDELNSTIGLLRAKLETSHNWQCNLLKIQTDIMNMMSHLATPSDCVKPNPKPNPKDGSIFCEEWIESISSNLSSKTEYFILPGGNEISALCHVIRTQVRRAERRIIDLYFEDEKSVEKYILQYFNRMSDLFFFLSREALETDSISEDRWELFRKR